MTNYKDTTIIIPTLNEQDNIGLLIQRLCELYPGIRVIVADDGSTDKTREIAEKLGALVIDRTHALVKGISASVVDGLDSVTTRFIVVMDADFQHPPENVKDIISLLETHDIVIAARRSVLGNWSVFRRLQSFVATVLAQIRLLRRVEDPLSGFFGVRTELFQSISQRNFEMRCFKILFNVLKNAKSASIGYVHYDFDLRKRGESKITSKHVWYFLRNLLR